MSSFIWIFCVCLLTCLLNVSVSEDQQITVKTGHDVTLQCLDHRGGDIEELEWRRQDLEEDVFVWKHGNMSEYQHPSFKNRVELRDPQMKDGDVSVILKNVTINDTGTYDCYVGLKGNSPQLISSVHLKVKVSDQQQITVKTGDDVTLQCLDHRGRDIELLEWSKPDLKSEDFVYYFRDEHSYEKYQHPLFSGRVELRDPQMKDGDVSVILRNSSISDTGKYQCYVGYGGRSDLISTINLTVVTSGDGAGAIWVGGVKDEYLGLVVVKTVQPGEDVLLLCQGPRGADIIFVKWIRPELISEGFVFLFRDDRTYKNYQVPCFHGRVKLRDPQMKDGDVSVILKNVTINDTGTYECYVRNSNTSTPSQLITTINLTVVTSGGGAGDTEDGGVKDRHVGLLVGLLVVSVLVVVVVVVVVVGFLIYRRCRRLNQQNNQCPAAEAAAHELQVLNPETEVKIE